MYFASPEEIREFLLILASDAYLIGFLLTFLLDQKNFLQKVLVGVTWEKTVGRLGFDQCFVLKGKYSPPEDQCFRASRSRIKPQKKSARREKRGASSSRQARFKGQGVSMAWQNSMYSLKEYRRRLFRCQVNIRWRNILRESLQGKFLCYLITDT